MIPADPFTPPPADAVVVGAGRLTLDVIVRTVPDQGAAEPPRSQAGGTCGNVLVNLAYLGWRSYPLMDLGDDDPGRRFTNDLLRWGVRLDLVRQTPGEQTPVIIHHIRYPGAISDGGAVHSFSSRCPFCNQRLRYFEPVAVERVRERLSSVPAARAFFFDRDSEGSLLLARHCAEKGALVVYEPNYVGKEVFFPEALQTAHVLKFSGDKLPNLEDRHSLSAPLLVIETFGAKGLRYRDQRDKTRPREWPHMPALPVEVVRDAGGSGDWCTAGFIHRLGQAGLAGFLAASDDELREALRFGQALAAWGCAFEGARGAVYHGDHAAFVQAVRQVLAGQRPSLPEGEATFDLAGTFCPRCHGAPGSVSGR